MTEQELSFNYEMAEMALRGKRFKEAEEKYKEITAKTNSPEAWCGIAVSKYGQLMTTYAVDDVFYCFQKAKSIDESKISEIETIAIETSLEVIKSLYDLIILTGKAMDQAQIQMARAALGTIVGAVSTFRNERRGSVIGTIASAGFTAISFNEYVNAGTSLEDMKALNSIASSLMVIIKSNVQKLVTKELVLADKFHEILNKSYEEVTVTIPTIKRVGELKIYSKWYKYSGWLFIITAIAIPLMFLFEMGDSNNQNYHPGINSEAIQNLGFGFLFFFIIGYLLKKSGKKREAQAAELEDTIKKEAKNNKIAAVHKIYFALVLIGAMLGASCQSNSERGKTSYESLPNDSRIEIFALYQAIDLYSARTANTNVLLDPTTITGNNESSKKQLKKHEDYQETLKSQLCEKVKNHYNISEATFQHIIADGETNSWGYRYRISEATLLDVAAKGFNNNWSYNSPTRTLEAQEIIDSTKIYMGQHYGGGIVVFILQPGDKGYDSSVPHGLIVAPQDQNLTNNENQKQEIPWAAGDGNVDSPEKGNMKKTGASGTAVGTGLANTKAIVSRFGEGNYAAWICHSLTLGGYKDWYLPSKDELFVLKVNQEQIGGFMDGAYWSSSESDKGNAWTIDLKHGNEQTYLKHEAHNVRAVRSF